MGYLEQPLQTYVDALASGEATPGGGSAAALVGALAAALNSMVANFTVGREKYAAVQEDVQSALVESERLRAELQGLVQADTEAYGMVAASYKLPRETEEQKLGRTMAIQAALRSAVQVPMAVARACRLVLLWAADLADKGNPNLITDAGVSAKLALAALECAVLNAEVNLVSMTDKTYVNACQNELQALVEESEGLAREVWRKVIRAVRKAK